MGQLNVKLQDHQLEALRRYASRRRTPVAWLIKDYVAYLLAGGSPVGPAAPETQSGAELAALAQSGRAHDWLAEEPELYSSEDGERL